jgi:hypothetical protein
MVFSFETGAIPALFLTAAKCRHPQLRRAAVNVLLEHGERQENLWKAKKMGHFAARLIELETQAADEFQRQASQPSTVPPSNDGCTYQPRTISGVNADVGYGSRESVTASCNLSDPQPSFPTDYSVAMPTNIPPVHTMPGVRLDCIEAPFGLPDHLRISDALVTQCEEKEMWVTFFRKPHAVSSDWEIWNEHIVFK